MHWLHISQLLLGLFLCLCDDLLKLFFYGLNLRNRLVNLHLLSLLVLLKIKFIIIGLRCWLRRLRFEFEVQADAAALLL